MIKPSERSFCRPENLTLFHYGELDATDRLRVERHLQECAFCRRELEELRSILEVLPKGEPEFATEDIRAFNERVGRRPRSSPRRLLEPALGWSFAAAAAVLLMVNLHAPAPGPPQLSPEVTLQTDAEMGRLPEPELLLNLELLENLDLLQELEGTGIRG